MPETHREPYAFNHNKSKYYLDEDLADLAEAKININNVLDFLGNDFITTKSFSTNYTNVTIPAHGYKQFDINIKKTGYIPLGICMNELLCSTDTDLERLSKAYVAYLGVGPEYAVMKLGSGAAIGGPLSQFKWNIVVVYIKDPSSLVA